MTIPVLRLLPLISLAAVFLVPWFGFLQFTELDLASLVLLYLFGGVLFVLKKRKIPFVSFILWPLGFGAGLATLLFISSWLREGSTWGEWCSAQMSSHIFPYFFHEELWPEEARDVFLSVVQPILEQSLVAWAGGMAGISFFMSGLADHFLRSFSGARSAKMQRLWTQYTEWRCPDMVLLSLVLGMALVVLEGLLSGPVIAENLRFAVKALGWNLTILSLFPIFIQGTALASYLIPRFSFLFAALFIVLLVIGPIPVLTLAGLGDLWFDFRTRMNQNPKSDEED